MKESVENRSANPAHGMIKEKKPKFEGRRAIECLSGYPGLHHKSSFQKETTTRISNSIS